MGDWSLMSDVGTSTSTMVLVLVSGRGCLCLVVVAIAYRKQTRETHGDREFSCVLQAATNTTKKKSIIILRITTPNS